MGKKKKKNEGKSPKAQQTQKQEAKAGGDEEYPRFGAVVITEAPSLAISEEDPSFSEPPHVI
ncbi:hypothetical protein ACQB60_22705 [Actinomycetota bacterium Odt1-20B]